MGAMDVLKNQCELLEYYNMADPFKDGDYENYTTSSRDIYLLDLDRATWERFTLMQALDASGRYNGEGKPVDVLANNNSSKIAEKFMSPLDQIDSGYYIDSQGRQRLVRYMGQIEDTAFSGKSVVSLARSVIRQMNGLSATPQQAAYHMNVLQRAVQGSQQHDPNDPKVMGYLAAMMAKVTTTGTNPRGGIVEWMRTTGGAFELPSVVDAANPRVGTWESASFDVVPFGGNYAMLRSLVRALVGTRDETNFYAKYRLNFRRASEIEKALEMFDEVARSLERLLPGSALLETSNSAPWFWEPTPVSVLFDQTLGENRLPLFFRKQSMPAKSQADGSDLRVAIDKDEIISQVLGISTTYANDVMARLTGRLVVKSQKDARPKFVGAKIDGNDAPDAVVFDEAPAAGAKPYSTDFALQNALPAYAKSLYPGAKANTPVNPAAGDQFANIVKILFNYRLGAADDITDKHVLAERNRAIALLLISSVSTKADDGTDAPAATITARLKALFDGLLSATNNVDAKPDRALNAGEVKPIFGSERFDDVMGKIVAFINKENKAARVFNEDGQRNIGTQMKGIFNSATRAFKKIAETNEAAAAKPAAEDGKKNPPPASLVFEAGEYLRTPLTFGPAQFEWFYQLAIKSGAPLSALPADPRDPDQVVPLMSFVSYAEMLQKHDPEMPAALYDAVTLSKSAYALSMVNYRLEVVARAARQDTYADAMEAEKYTLVGRAEASAAARRDPYSGRLFSKLKGTTERTDDYAAVGVFGAITQGSASANDFMAGDTDGMVSASFAKNWTTVGKLCEGLELLVAKTYLCQEHHRRVFEAAAINSTLFPKRFASRGVERCLFFNCVLALSFSRVSLYESHPSMIRSSCSVVLALRP
jgi:hypothetical protein